MLWARLPCSSFVWIARATSKPSRASPAGHGPMAEEGNCLATRVVLMCLTAMMRKAWWVCEQPNSSLTFRLPVFDWLFRINRVKYDLAPATLTRLCLGYVPPTQFPSQRSASV